MQMITKPHLSAIGGKTSLPARICKNAGLFKVGSTLDFGAGRERDTAFLEAVAHDKYFRPEMPDSGFDNVWVSYVLNVLEHEYFRIEAVAQAWAKVKRGGRLFLVARPVKEVAAAVKPTWKILNDGYQTPRNTFQRGMSEAELLEYCDKAGCDYARVAVPFKAASKFSVIVIEKR